MSRTVELQIIYVRKYKDKLWINSITWVVFMLYLKKKRKKKEERKKFNQLNCLIKNIKINLKIA